MRGHRVVVQAWGDDPMQALEEHMQLEPQERPTSLGAHDVLLRVRACAVGWVDLIMSSGQYQHMAQPPYTPGLEFAGEVEAIGSEVRAVAVGDRILADGFKTGPRSSGNHQRWGGFASWALLPEEAALSIPDQLDYGQACNLLGNWETAYHGLVVRARLRSEEWVLVNGASGATGIAAVQLAKLLGARVIATGRSAEKLDALRSLGADHVVQTVGPDGDQRAFRGEVKALTDGGAHVVWDGVGGPLSVESIRSMRFGGRFCIIGWAATPDVARGRGLRGAPRANQLPTNLVQMKGLDVLGCPAVISTKHDPSLRPERLSWIMDRVARGDIVPHVGPSYSLSDFRAAMRAKWSSRHLGGCLVIPD